MRRRVDWYQIMCDLDNQEVYQLFFPLFCKLRKGKSMSKNRCAYNALKNYYSTTTIAELCEKLGV